MLSRQDVLQAIRPVLDRSAVIAPLGNTVRELYRIADKPSNLYLLGSMGMPIPVGLGVALGQPQRMVLAIEGDGGALMNLGALATAAAYGPPNLRILLFDNGAYESTGGQASHSATSASLCEIARGCGFHDAVQISTATEIGALSDWLTRAGLRIAVIKTGMTTEKERRVPLAPPAIYQRFADSLREEGTIKEVRHASDDE